MIYYLFNTTKTTTKLGLILQVWLETKLVF